jgi:hypothetical protein
MTYIVPWTKYFAGEIYGTGSSYLLLYGTGTFAAAKACKEALVAEI